MHIYSRNLIIVIMTLMMSCSNSMADITPPWSTTWDCPEMSWPTTMTCDGIIWGGNNENFDPYFSQITSAANNPNGGGVNGFRVWTEDRIAAITATVKVQFSEKKELYIRWVMRYQPGFKWNPLQFHKHLYINTNELSTSVIPEPAGDNDYTIGIQNVPGGSQQLYVEDVGWKTIMGYLPEDVGPYLSDGDFHTFEIYLKMDTTLLPTPNGIGRLFIDGDLKLEKTDVNFSNGSETARLGWKEVRFPSNQYLTDNGVTPFYVDSDDMAIYDEYQLPPNVYDPGGLDIPWIGLASSGDGPTVVLQNDYQSTSPATYSGTATATAGRTISGVVSSNGYTVTPDDGVWDELVESFTVSGVLPTVTDTCTATDSSTENGNDSITITLLAPPSSSTPSTALNTGTLKQSSNTGTLWRAGN